MRQENIPEIILEKEVLMMGGKRFVFDIDGVITKLQETLDYSLAAPNTSMIDVVNKLYDMGNYIVFFTARGYVTGIDWREVTEQQFLRWGVKYHELHFGKPNADYYIDDKFVGANQLLQLFDRDINECR